MDKADLLEYADQSNKAVFSVCACTRVASERVSTDGVARS